MHLIKMKFFLINSQILRGMIQLMEKINYKVCKHYWITNYPIIKKIRKTDSYKSRDNNFQ